MQASPWIGLSALCLMPRTWGHEKQSEKQREDAKAQKGHE
jgi:hypothetical protein